MKRFWRPIYLHVLFCFCSFTLLKKLILAWHSSKWKITDRIASTLPIMMYNWCISVMYTHQKWFWPGRYTFDSKDCYAVMLFRYKVLVIVCFRAFGLVKSYPFYMNNLKFCLFSSSVLTNNSDSRLNFLVVHICVPKTFQYFYSDS